MSVLFWRKKKSAEPAEPAEPFCLNAEGMKAFSLGNYEFAFYYRGNQLFELIPRALLYVYQHQILRLGHVLTDGEGRKWLISRVEGVTVKEKYLHIGSPSEKDRVAFSESGFIVATYTIEEFNKEVG